MKILFAISFLCIFYVCTSLINVALESSYYMFLFCCSSCTNGRLSSLLQLFFILFPISYHFNCIPIWLEATLLPLQIWKRHSDTLKASTSWLLVPMHLLVRPSLPSECSHFLNSTPPVCTWWTWWHHQGCLGKLRRRYTGVSSQAE